MVSREQWYWSIGSSGSGIKGGAVGEGSGGDVVVVISREGLDAGVSGEMDKGLDQEYLER